jgi:hypothetical protein
MFLLMQATGSTKLIFLDLTTPMILCCEEDFKPRPNLLWESSVVYLLSFLKVLLEVVMAGSWHSLLNCTMFGVRKNLVQIQLSINSHGMLLSTQRTITLYLLCLITSNNLQLFENY